MIKSTENIIKQQIKDGLSLLEEKHLTLFRRMYAPEQLDNSIDDIVDQMPVEKLKHALFQIENTI